MRITSDEANKILKKLDDEKRILFQDIDNRATFIASVSEDAEKLRPEFNFVDALKKIDEIDAKMLKIKSARAKFNTEMHLTSGLNIGEALVRMSILNNRIGTYRKYAIMQEKARNNFSNNKEIEYIYTNFNHEDAVKKYQSVQAEVLEIQRELNVLNATELFDVDV